MSETLKTQPNDSTERKGMSLLTMVIAMPVVTIVPLFGAAFFMEPTIQTNTATDAAHSAVERLESGSSDFTYSRLSAESLSREEGLAESAVTVTVTAADGAEPTADAYCVTAINRNAAVHYDSSTQEYTETSADEAFTCEATPAGWN